MREQPLFHDTDIVIDPSLEQLRALVEHLVAAGFYADAKSAEAAFHDRRVFNVIETGHARRLAPVR